MHFLLGQARGDAVSAPLRLVQRLEFYQTRLELAGLGTEQRILTAHQHLLAVHFAAGFADVVLNKTIGTGTHDCLIR